MKNIRLVYLTTSNGAEVHTTYDLSNTNEKQAFLLLLFKMATGELNSNKITIIKQTK